MDQIAKGKIVRIDPASPNPPEIQILITSIAIGFYSAYRIEGSKHPLICQGSSADPPKTCKIGNNSATLPGRLVSWQVGIAGATATDPFNLTVIFTQDGKVLDKFTYPQGQGDDLTVDYVTLG
jgi:hypothetical protein